MVLHAQVCGRVGSRPVYSKSLPATEGFFFVGRDYNVAMNSRCTDCYDGLFEASGKCRVCHGSGKNIHLNSDSADCEYCQGSGVCPVCGGSGIQGEAQIQTLFGAEDVVD